MKDKKFYGGEYDYITDSILLGKNRKKTLGDNKTTLKCYVTSNEWLGKYLPDFKFEGARVLTVGSSGDQALNAILYGAKDVVVVDANPMARAFIEYKIALIKNFRGDEVLELLSGDRNLLFSSFIYKKLSHSLSKDVQQLFDRIILESSDDWTLISTNDVTCSTLSRNFFQGRACFYSNFYKTQEDYDNLKKKLLKGDFALSFRQGFVKDFPKIVEGKFDVIMLSNIKMHIKPIREKLAFEAPIKKLYENNLNEGGIIQFEYSYDGIECLSKNKENKKFVGKKPEFFGNYDYFVGIIKKEEKVEENIM